MCVCVCVCVNITWDANKTKITACCMMIPHKLRFRPQPGYESMRCQAVY